MMWFYYRFLHRPLMRLAHRFDWHYAPVIGPLQPGGGYQQWCQWCGLRATYHRPSPDWKRIAEDCTR